MHVKNFEIHILLRHWNPTIESNSNRLVQTLMLNQIELISDLITD